MKRVCVTGAGGFCASCSSSCCSPMATMSMELLETQLTIKFWYKNGFGDEKNAHLKKLDKASENLQLFKADLLDYNAVCAAITGCEGVFHVASPVITTKVVNPEVELFAPAVEGTLNVLKACCEANVKRVVVVASVASVCCNPNWPRDKVIDEDSWSNEEYCRITENWYCLSKTMAEREALNFAAKHGIDVVTVLPALVLGPLLQSTVNASSSFLINILNGNRELVENKVWHYVDVRDTADALLLAYEKPEASGRYICAPQVIDIRGSVEMLKVTYPDFNYPTNYIEVHEEPLMSSDKLKMRGWKWRPLKETLLDSVEYYKEAGLLE